jgi:ArsR family transcriptional regulator
VPEDRNELVDKVFKAMASAPRRQILAMLASGAGEGDDRCCGPYDVCACRFAEDLGLTAQTVSHHMRVLLDAGLVSARKEGLWVYYKIRPETVQAVVTEICTLWPSNVAGCCVVPPTV